jgi:hypothetical protein
MEEGKEREKKESFSKERPHGESGSVGWDGFLFVYDKWHH